MKVIDFLSVARSDIIFIVGISSLAGFLANPSFMNRPIIVFPLLVTGLLASASAAIFNNLYDSDIDDKMERTKYRVEIIRKNRQPLMVAGFIMLALSVILAYFMISLLSSVFIFLGFVTYTIIYTIVLKRRTYWSIVIGGAAASFAALAGWTSMNNGIGFMPMFLAVLLFAWIPMHFWAFAASHTRDYENAGIPMLPAVLGLRKSSIIIFGNSLILGAIAISSFFLTKNGLIPAYVIIIVVLSLALCYVSVLSVVREKSEKIFHKVYQFSHVYISVILVMFILMSNAFI